MGAAFTQATSSSRKSNAEKLDRSLPGVGGGVRFVDLFARVVEEGVIGSGIDYELHVLPHFFQLLLELPSLFGRNAPILLAVDQQHRCAEIVPVPLCLFEPAV